MSVRERANPKPTAEEKDALARTRKKVRADEGKFSNDQSLFPRDEEWMHDVVVEDVGVEDEVVDHDQTREASATGGQRMEAPQGSGLKWKSFKHVFTQGKDEVDEEDDWWKERVQVEMTERGPNVIIPRKEKDRLAKRWSRSLIIKLLGRMVDYTYLESKVQQLWAKQGEVETIDVGGGFSMVKFLNINDYESAITGGLWLLFDHYLVVQPWKEDFNPDVETISKIAAWIRIDKLPLDYYDCGILYVLGSQVGRVLKLDMTTLKRKKGCFACICVELDLNTPFCPVILINGIEKRVQYESIHLVCFECGRYGYDSDHCPYKKEKIDAREAHERSTQKESQNLGVNENTVEGTVQGELWRSEVFVVTFDG